MGKIIYAINLSIDGCCDHTKVDGGDEEMLDFYTNLVREAGALAYGRITYELMVPYWPDIVKDHTGQSRAEIDFAEAFDAADKIVFSKSLTRVEDERSRLVRTKAEDELVRLKGQPGGYILLGGVALPSHLIALGLIDEYSFVIHPSIAGEGRRLMEGIPLQKEMKLKLVDSKVFKSGSVALRYKA